jgi:hypothetical protein
LDNEEFHDSHSSPNIIKMIRSRRMRWEEHIARVEEKRNALETLVGKPKAKIPLEKPRHSWEDNIKVNLGEIDWMIWTGFVWLGIGTSGGLS